MNVERDSDQVGIYIHFPYCIRKCTYCDFFSLGLENLQGNQSSEWKGVDRDQLRAFRIGILSEFSSRLSSFSRFEKINTIYFGGGTASLLPAEEISVILDGIKREFSLSPTCEITLEGNPENFSNVYLRELVQCGVTRVNVGLQSFAPEHLEEMNRYYSRERYESILSDLKDAKGLIRGVDLIYGFPNQSENVFYADLDRVLSAGLDHLSIYALTAEQNTPYLRHIKQGKLPEPDESMQTRIFQALPELLAKHGLQQYEISNFSVPGAMCRHNLRYWLYEPYLALGPGAHGFDGRRRYNNPRNLAAWLTAIKPDHGQAHRLDTDLPVNILRLTVPFPINMIREILEENGIDDKTVFHRVQKLMESWREIGYAHRSNIEIESGQEQFDSMFQWTMHGLNFLDDRILDMVMTLSDA